LGIKNLIFFGGDMKKIRIVVAVLCFNGLLALFSITAAPDFLILGVTKCGTTSLYDYIVKHPKILGARTKELHFFDNNYEKGIDWYHQQFPQKKSMDELIGEATPRYFWHQTCMKRIFEHCPNTKFIVIFRNPVKRVVSEYYRRRRSGAERLDFERAILQPQLRERYIEAGLYIEHLERWLSIFPKNQILVLILEDLAKAPEQEVNKIFKFLGLGEYKLHSYEIRNQAQYDINKIQPETINTLKHFYEPYNKKLEIFLGRTLPW